MSDVETTAPRKTVLRVARYWLPLLAWMGMIFYLSAQPDLPGPPEPWLHAVISNSAHFGLYAVLAYLWWRALRSLRDRQGPQRACWEKVTDRGVLALVFLVSVLYGMSDEFHQSFVPGRHPSLLDLLVDAIGAGVVVWVVWRRLKHEGNEG